MTSAPTFPAPGALPRLGGLYDTHAEGLLALRPDLALVSETSPAAGTLEHAGVPTWGGSAATFDAIPLVITAIGALVCRPGEAARLVRELAEGTAAVEKASAGRPRVRVYYELDASFYTVGPHSFVGTMIAKAGGQDIVPESLGDFPKISPEAVIAGNPEVIFGVPLRDARAAGWDKIDAVSSRPRLQAVPRRGGARRPPRPARASPRALRVPAPEDPPRQGRRGGPRRPARARPLAAIVGPALVLAIAVSVAVGNGARPIAVSATLSALAQGLRGHGASLEGVQAIVWNLRMPRVLMALVVGASLGSSGAAMQGFFRNPLAGPYVLGVAGGASLGATLAMTVGGRLSAGFAAGPFESGGAPAWVPIFAFAGATGAVLAVLVLSKAGTRSRTTSLLLAGIVVGTIMVAIDECLLLLDADRLRAVILWSIGNLSLASWPDVERATPYAFAGTGAALRARAQPRSAMALGDDTAHARWVSVRADFAPASSPGRASRRRRPSLTSAPSASWGSSHRTSCAGSDRQATACSFRRRRSRARPCSSSPTWARAR